MRGGCVHAASDRQAAYPTTPPVSPDDLAATIYHALGIDPRGDPRPARQAVGAHPGRVVRGLF